MLLSFSILFFFIQTEARAQGGAGRQPIRTPTPTPNATPNPAGGRSNTAVTPIKRDPVPVKRATLTMTLPEGSRVWINQIEVEVRDSDRPINVGGQRITTTYSVDQRVLTIFGLKTGACEIIVRKTDHREFMQTLDLVPDRSNPIMIHLTPNPGTLTVKPSVADAQVEVLNAENEMSLGRYRDHLDRFEIVPGNYRVDISKEGYITATRQIRIRPGESVYLELALELQPKPKPTPPKRLVVPESPTRFSVQASGKEEIFSIRGSSGNTSITLGTISVRHGGPLMTHSIEGALNGLPCQVDFVRLENVAEAAVIQPPGPLNQWSVVVIRLRRKDQKRAVSFAINWKSLQPVGVVDHEAQTETFTPARTLLKIKPNFPNAKRHSLTESKVNVLVFINEFGSVVSAKAIDGPLFFRQISEEAARNWKFFPALRNGVAVESQQTLQFIFKD